jgi:hypothetical protein
MATNFPTSLDALTNPASSDQLSSPSHSAQHVNANDAIEALQTKVGVDNSASTTTLDYRVKQLETVPTYTNEMAQDAVAAALAAGTHTNITINYNDTGNSISISAAAGYTNEEAVDAVAAALTQGSGISIAYNDAANTITISVDSSVVLKTGATMTGALTLSGAPTSNLHAATKAYVDTATATVTSNSTTTYIPLSSIGVADGVASLNSSGVIPDAQIPAAIARDSEVSSAISTAVNNLINSAPGTLDTLGEIATALAADESAAAALTTVVNGKVSKAGGDIITASADTVKPLVLKGFSASQAQNILEIQGSNATVNAAFKPNGALYTGSAASAISARLAVSTNTTTNPGIIVRGVASQTANLTEWQDSAGTVISSINAAGNTLTISGIATNYINPSAGANTPYFDMGATTSNTITLVQRTASAVGLIIKAAASQTANLMEFQNSSGTAITYFNSNGGLTATEGVISTLYSGGYLTTGTRGYYNATTFAPSVIPIVVRGTTSQTANLQEWQNSAGTMLARIDANGLIYLPGGSWHLVNNQETWYKNNTSFYQKGASHTFRRQSDEADLLTIGGNGNTSILLNSALAVGLIVKGAASQTANLQEWQNSAGTVLAKMDSTGILTTTDFSTGSVNASWRVFSTSGSSTVVPITAKGAASQTANLQEWQNSSGTVLAKVDSAGVGTFAQGIFAGGAAGIDGGGGATLGAIYTGALKNSATAYNFFSNVTGSPYATMVIKQLSGQTTNLQEWQNSAGTVLSYIKPDGSLFVAGNSNTILVSATASSGVHRIISNGNDLNISPYYDGIFGPAVSSGSWRPANDATSDLGTSGQRWKDLYATSSTLTNNSASKIGLIVKGAASQTANLQQWQNSAGTVLSFITSNGELNTPNIGLAIYGGIYGVGSYMTFNPGDTRIVSSGTSIGNASVAPSAQLQVTNGVASTIAMIVKGAASQTGSLQEWQDSAGTVMGRIDGQYGTIRSISGIDLTNTYTGASTITARVNYPATVPVIILGAASQTADLQQWQNSANTVLAKVDASGAMFTITPADSTNTTQVATTAYVKNNINNLINSAPGTLDTLGEIATALAASDSAAAALVTSVNLKAPLASPALTGTPTAPTATAGTNTTQLATTAFVKTEITSSVQPGAVYQTSAPSSPAVGQIWIDSDEDVTTFDSNIFNRQSFTATASQTVFTSSVPFIEGYEQVYFNGLMLSRSADYTTSGSNTVTLASGAAVNDIIEIVTITALNAYVASQPVSISANTNLTASKRYFVTSASALTLTLPANPSLNDQIDVVDASGNALTYNITIARNGKLINGLAVNLIIDTAGSFISLLYTGPTYGWRAQ